MLSLPLKYANQRQNYVPTVTVEPLVIVINNNNDDDDDDDNMIIII